MSPQKYIYVRNWKRWQRYQADRGQPPWIKLHRALLRNYEWICLSDAQRGQLTCLWLLAADRDGWIPASPKVCQRLAGMESEPDLKLFIDLEFLEQKQNVSNLDPSWIQVEPSESESETETETEAETEKNVAPPALNNPPADKRKAPWSPEAWQEAEHLASRMRQNDPKAKIPKGFIAWARDMERIHAIDGRSWEEISRVIDWCQSDPFWLSNILSPSKLRKQFATLALQAARPRGRKGGDQIDVARRFIERQKQESMRIPEEEIDHGTE